MIEKDIEAVRDASVEVRYSEIQTILKTLVGKSHEYTLEESLFVLWGEKIISEEEYIQLKKNIVALVYTKYATNHEKKPNLNFDLLKKQLLNAAKNAKTTLEEYETIKSELREYPKESKELSNVQKHKKEIYLAEQELFESMREAENNAKEQTLKNKSELKQSKVPTAQINFPDVFLKITGIELKNLNDLKTRVKTNTAEIWDLYVKYCIMEQIDPTHIIKELKDEHKSLKTILDALDRNALYKESISDILYMKDVIHATLAITYTYVRGIDQNYIHKQLKKQGYSKDIITFVHDQIFDRVTKE